jgi:hypothetical protein
MFNQSGSRPKANHAESTQGANGVVFKDVARKSLDARRRHFADSTDLHLSKVLVERAQVFVGLVTVVTLVTFLAVAADWVRVFVKVNVWFLVLEAVVTVDFHTCESEFLSLWASLKNTHGRGLWVVSHAGGMYASCCGFTIMLFLKILVILVTAVAFVFARVVVVGVKVLAFYVGGHFYWSCNEKRTVFIWTRCEIFLSTRSYSDRIAQLRQEKWMHQSLINSPSGVILWLAIDV